MPTLKALALVVKGELHGNPELEITGVGSLEGAGPDQIAPFDSKKYLRAAHRSSAGAFLANQDLGVEIRRPCITHPYPLLALNTLMKTMELIRRPRPTGIHPSAVVDTVLDESVAVGPCAVVYAGASIGARTILHAHVVVETGAVLGEDCVVEPGAVIHDGAVIGNRVHIGAHAVVSRQGFGFAPGPAGPVRLHHIGRVVIEDDVHIGAGSMIDRARFDETRIGRMSALDNLVHVGHNCTIGQRSFLAAQTGLAGSAFIGDDCQVGGQVGFANRTGVGDRSLVAAQTGLMKAFGADSDIMWSPARPRKRILRLLARMMKH